MLLFCFFCIIVTLISVYIEFYFVQCLNVCVSLLSVVSCLHFISFVS